MRRSLDVISDDQKVSPATAHLRDAPHESRQSCATCYYFVPKLEQCRVVAGTVTAGQVSDLWEPRGIDLPHEDSGAPEAARYGRERR